MRLSPTLLALALLALTLALLLSGLGFARVEAQEAIEETTTVGPVTATVRLSPPKPKIGDLVELTLEVTSDPEVEILLPDFGEALDRFMIRDFDPTPAHLDDKGRTVQSQSYELQTRVSGRQRIPSILVEFVDRRPGKRPAPDGEDAFELLTEALEFEVESVLPSGAATELRPPLAELPPRPVPASSRWPLWAGLAAIVVIAIPFLVRAILHWRRLARRRSAYDVAHSQLEKLLRGGIPDESDALDRFFVEISAIIRQYIENRFELRAPDFTTEEFLDVVSDSPDVSADHQRILRDFLRCADLVKFAHVLPPREELEESVSIARRFLEETREASPLIEVADDTGAANDAKGAAHA